MEVEFAAAPLPNFKMNFLIHWCITLSYSRKSYAKCHYSSRCKNGPSVKTALIYPSRHETLQLLENPRRDEPGRERSSIGRGKKRRSGPKVRDAAVFGVPDEKRGEIPVAVVVAEPGSEVSFDELSEFSRIRLAGYKVPRRIILVDALPRVHGWKLLRRTLRE